MIPFSNEINWSFISLIAMAVTSEQLANTSDSFSAFPRFLTPQPRTCIVHTYGIPTQLVPGTGQLWIRLLTNCMIVDLQSPAEPVQILTSWISRQKHVVFEFGCPHLRIMVERVVYLPGLHATGPLLFILWMDYPIQRIIVFHHPSAIPWSWSLK